MVKIRTNLMGSIGIEAVRFNSKRDAELSIPPTELWLVQPERARERTADWTEDDNVDVIDAGIQTQTVDVVPPSRPNMTPSPVDAFVFALSRPISRHFYTLSSLSLSLFSLSLYRFLFYEKISIFAFSPLSLRFRRWISSNFDPLDFWVFYTIF